MDYSINTISMEFSFLDLRVCWSNDVFLSLIVLSKQTVQTQIKCHLIPYVAFHLGLHCLPFYLFTCIQNERVKKLGYQFHTFDCFLVAKLLSVEKCIDNL